MRTPLTRFFNPKLAEEEKKEKERLAEEKEERDASYARLRNNSDFQRFVKEQIEARIKIFSDIDNMPDKGNLELELFGRKQKLAELKDILHNINS